MSQQKDEHLFKLYFDLRLYQADGQSFQRFASDIFFASFPDFQSIAPYGSYGDGGNDGYIRQEQRYFQMYAPNSSPSPAVVIHKAKEDFNKLCRNYPVKRYSFVFNDRYNGTPAPVASALDEMQKQTGIPCDIIDSRNLADLFMELPDSRRRAILGCWSSELPDWIDPRAVAEVLQHLADRITSITQPKDSAPDFDEKIRFNGLDGLIAKRLHFFSTQTTEIDDFLAPRGAHLAQAIAQELKRLYQDGLNEVPDNCENASAVRYIWMREQLLPKEIRIAPVHTQKSYLDAAEVVLAKYFESCDIYEKPGTGCCSA